MDLVGIVWVSIWLNWFNNVLLRLFPAKCHYCRNSFSRVFCFICHNMVVCLLTTLENIQGQRLQTMIKFKIFKVSSLTWQTDTSELQKAVSAMRMNKSKSAMSPVQHNFLNPSTISLPGIMCEYTVISTTLSPLAQHLHPQWAHSTDLFFPQMRVVAKLWYPVWMQWEAAETFQCKFNISWQCKLKNNLRTGKTVTL